MSPGRLNPYKIGIELFRDIEDRWNKGKFGKEYDECDDLEAKKRWDRKLGLGRQKIFEVRKIYNDVMFIDAFMNEEFCERLKLYVYGYDARTGRHVVVSRDWRKVKERLLFQLTNLGQPIIHVTDANYANRGELYLQHALRGHPPRRGEGARHPEEPAPGLAAARPHRDRGRRSRAAALLRRGRAQVHAALTSPGRAVA